MPQESTRQLTRSLYRAGTFPGDSPPDEATLRSLINEGRRLAQGASSMELEVGLASAIGTYVFYFVRAERRRPWLADKIERLERALKYSRECAEWDVLAGQGEHSLQAQGPPRERIGAWLGHDLVKQAPIRDLRRAVEILEPIYQQTKAKYVPELCSYADALYKTGRYSEAADVAEELGRRADVQWRPGTTPGPYKLVARALRAEANRLMRSGAVNSAGAVLTRLMATGHATPTDAKRLDRVRTETINIGHREEP